MKGCTNDYSANLTISDFLAGVEKFVWGNIDPCQEYTLYETLEELTTQFRRVSEAEQFAADLAIQFTEQS
jgi:calcineurin-like phosphoesterase family protein